MLKNRNWISLSSKEVIMSKKRWMVLAAWLVILALFFYLFFFQSDLFYRLFHYSGAGSPFVVTPSGGGD
ncbi:hypothetical protein pah_c022o033 [Parachlamydia acanthamoebae str. Hall's coccus]|nr:hypothetical protein pah_c022o033 [Parachlamydia acanthamoebae str. Hall's coccus]